MKSQHWISTFLVSAVAAALIWIVSPWLSGHSEPWDADSYFYVTGLAVAGLLSGLLSPRVTWAYYVGSVAGQIIYALLFLPMGPLFAIGLVFLLAYAIVFLVAATLASYVRVRLVGLIGKS